MDPATRRFVAAGAVLAPLLHSITDAMEWMQDGFSPLQLWLNYLAFLPVPAIMIGLYAAQRPAMARYGLVGAVLYGFAFIYFTFTTLTALGGEVPSYEVLWSQLGHTYTIHGALMIVGGVLFGVAALRAGAVPAWAPTVFLAGIGLNLLLVLIGTADIYQIFGTALRNLGLVGTGWSIWRTAHGKASA